MYKPITFTTHEKKTHLRQVFQTEKTRNYRQTTSMNFQIQDTKYN